MAKRYCKKWYRSQRTTQERRANGTRKDRVPYVRAKRNAANLTNAWDDRPHCIQKSWKVKRDKQYWVGGRGKKHSVYVNSTKSYGMWRLTWELEEYFKDHNIPYNIETVRETYTYRREIQTWVFKGYRMSYFGYLMPIGEWVGTGKFSTHKGSTIKGYNIVWWTDKDIGIDYILKRVQQ